MSEAVEATTAETEDSSETLRATLLRLRRVAPVGAWVFGLGVALPAYNRGDLLDAVLRGGAVWALAVVVWMVGLTICERLLLPEVDETTAALRRASRMEMAETAASLPGKETTGMPVRAGK